MTYTQIQIIMYDTQIMCRVLVVGSAHTINQQPDYRCIGYKYEYWISKKLYSKKKQRSSRNHSETLTYKSH